MQESRSDRDPALLRINHVVGTHGMADSRHLERQSGPSANASGVIKPDGSPLRRIFEETKSSRIVDAIRSRRSEAALIVKPEVDDRRFEMMGEVVGGREAGLRADRPFESAEFWSETAFIPRRSTTGGRSPWP